MAKSASSAACTTRGYLAGCAAAVFFASLISCATVALGFAPIFSQCSRRSALMLTFAGEKAGS
jgi:hypothetical protein